MDAFFALIVAFAFVSGTFADSCTCKTERWNSNTKCEGTASLSTSLTTDRTMNTCSNSGSISNKYESCSKQLLYTQSNCQGSPTTVDFDGNCLAILSASTKITCSGAAALKPVAALVAALLAMLMFSML
eukprot:NODE_3404_length_672_cov_369.667737_g2425_i0.p2 GENE.NODE_3404_length_672_cov_369.667737_g2425_i0~~NODE_3404_length_672_cov_369.667737_g2425_i0.p2  ORF type:complete len:151 (-),score=59.13 NODE_3404_length_672_cov_369.667737_g2425_i0:220-606(-)